MVTSPRVPAGVTHAGSCPRGARPPRGCQCQLREHQCCRWSLPFSESAASIPGRIIWPPVAQVATVQEGRNQGPAFIVRGEHPQLGLHPGRRGNQPGLSPGRSCLAQHALLCGTLPEPRRAPLHLSGAPGERASAHLPLTALGTRSVPGSRDVRLPAAGSCPLRVAPSVVLHPGCMLESPAAWGWGVTASAAPGDSARQRRLGSSAAQT